MQDKPKGLHLLGLALRNRKTAIMAVFGFAAGLPFSLLLGTLNAWLGEAKIDLATIGVLSWIGLAYAFKFLWSPVVDRTRPPLLARLGRRRSWLFLCQLLIAATLMLLSMTDPALAIGTFALVAVIGAFAAATQDVVIDAWRIDVADEVATVEILSSVYQLGYRLAALVGGALALVLAARISWPTVYFFMGILMLGAMIATSLAPDTAKAVVQEDESELRRAGAIDPRLRLIGLALVGAAWIWAILSIVIFMVRILTADPNDPSAPKAADFTREMGPWIIAATILLPALIATYFNWARSRGKHVLHHSKPAVSNWDHAADHSFSALILPLSELIQRLKWGAVLALGIVLTYRLTDSIWGPFAYPFYMGEMGYTNDEVAFASKVFGVFMTMAGITIGAVMFATIGRMPTLLVGAIAAAITNLLYADLASGSYFIDRVSNFLALDRSGFDLRMIRLMIALSGENIAGGLAGGAYVAYLSSIASKRYSAVQYALLSSLTLLIGSLGRGALGEWIEIYGYAPVFRFTAALGGVAVLFCLLEWIRTAFVNRNLSTVGAIAEDGRVQARTGTSKVDVNP